MKMLRLEVLGGYRNKFLIAFPHDFRHIVSIINNIQSISHI